MLRTSSKKARENVRAYIMDNFDGCNYGIDTPKTFGEAAKNILSVFRDEKYSCTENYRYYNHCELAAFEDWAAGLPSILDSCYYYNRSAVDDLGEILEETAEEKSRFTEADAEKRLTWLIYRELLTVEQSVVPAT